MSTFYVCLLSCTINSGDECDLCLLFSDFWRLDLVCWLLAGAWWWWGGGMTQAVILEFDDDSGLQVFCHSLRLA